MAANAVPQTDADGVVRFDLKEEMKQAEARQPWASGIFSKTLLKQSDMRLVLVMMDQKAQMKDHHADGSVSVHVLKGRIHVSAEGREEELSEGEVATIPPSVRHQVDGLEPSAFLLTLSWPDSSKLQSMPHRGYGS